MVDKQIIDDKKYCILENDSIGLCVCKHRPCEQLDQLKAEHSLLKDEYKILEGNLDSRTRDFEEVIDNYQQTFAEIKEICNSVWGNGLDEEVDKFEQILQKISECEVGDE